MATHQKIKFNKTIGKINDNQNQLGGDGNGHPSHGHLRHCVCSLGVVCSCSSTLCVVWCFRRASVPTISTSRRGSLSGQLPTGSYMRLLLLFLAWLAQTADFFGFVSLSAVFSFQLELILPNISSLGFLFSKAA